MAPGIAGYRALDLSVGGERSGLLELTTRRGRTDHADTARTAGYERVA